VDTRVAAALLVGANLADSTTTWVLLQGGGVECNWFIAHGVAELGVTETLVGKALFGVVMGVGLSAIGASYHWLLWPAVMLGLMALSNGLGILFG